VETAYLALLVAACVLMAVVGAYLLVKLVAGQK
jgi:hypothetical protein